MWDWGIFIGSFVPAVVFGVAFGNLLQGVPFHMDEYMRLFYTGNFFQLLNPFGLLAGVVSLTMLVTGGDLPANAHHRRDPPAFTRCGADRDADHGGVLPAGGRMAGERHRRLRRDVGAGHRRNPTRCVKKWRIRPVPG